VDLIDRHSLAQQRAVTVPLVREVLKLSQAGCGGAGD
jgi:hypothetical protein